MWVSFYVVNNYVRAEINMLMTVLLYMYNYMHVVMFGRRKGLVMYYNPVVEVSHFFSCDN